MINGTLLIVDDETDISFIVEELFEEKIDKILIATNGQEGLNILKENIVHCVLTDINMPVMDGITFVKNARMFGFNIPFIFYTGHGSEKTMAEALRYNAFNFVEKPNLTDIEKIVYAGLKFGLGDDSIKPKEHYLESFKAFNEKKRLK